MSHTRAEFQIKKVGNFVARNEIYPEKKIFHSLTPSLGFNVTQSGSDRLVYRHLLVPSSSSSGKIVHRSYLYHVRTIHSSFSLFFFDLGFKIGGIYHQSVMPVQVRYTGLTHSRKDIKRNKYTYS